MAELAYDNAATRLRMEVTGRPIRLDGSARAGLAGLSDPGERPGRWAPAYALWHVVARRRGELTVVTDLDRTVFTANWSSA